MYTRSQPWSGMSHGQIVTQVAIQHSRLRFPPGTPRVYEELASSCMAFRAECRPGFEEICGRLQSMLEQVEGGLLLG